MFPHCIAIAGLPFGPVTISVRTCFAHPPSAIQTSRNPINFFIFSLLNMVRQTADECMKDVNLRKPSPKSDWHGQYSSYIQHDNSKATKPNAVNMLFVFMTDNATPDQWARSLAHLGPGGCYKIFSYDHFLKTYISKGLQYIYIVHPATFPFQ